MPSLRDYRDRIKSVKSTKKITSAMKMVAASKLRRAQENAEKSQPYARTMAAMLSRLAANAEASSAPKLMVGTGDDHKHLLVVVTADRGLCGGFNANIAKEVRNRIHALQAEGKEVSLICVGRKGYDSLVRDFREHIVAKYTDVMGKKQLDFADVQAISDVILSRFERDQFDVCTLMYNEFQSVLVQKPTGQQVIPFQVQAVEEDEEQSEDGGMKFPYSFEPSEEEILEKLLPRNLGIQIYGALLDSAAGEQAARMTAMDNATRNAGDMINDLTLEYNRARQAYITKELIEIISGAEAV